MSGLGQPVDPDAGAVAPTPLIAVPAPAQARPRSMWRLGVGVFLQNRLAVVGLVVIVLAVLFCWLGPVVHPTDQVHTNLMSSNDPPGAGHLLGTDSAGYDQLGRLMYGGQASLAVGIAAAILSTIVGTIYGAVSGYVGGWVDSVMMRIVDGLFAIPGLFLLIVLSTIFHPSEWVMIAIIAFFYWLGAARLVRGESLSLRVREYVQAVRVMGGGNARAVLRHVAPNAIGTVVVFATFTVADSILTLAFLGYLGLGLQPPQTDWGGMLSDATNYITSGYWWLLYPPGIAIIVVAIAFNFLGDALRDVFEVRLRER